MQTCDGRGFADSVVCASVSLFSSFHTIVWAFSRASGPCFWLFSIPEWFRGGRGLFTIMVQFLKQYLLWLYMYIYMYTYLCVCVCMYVCMYIYIYIRVFVYSTSWLPRCGPRAKSFFSAQMVVSRAKATTTNLWQTNLHICSARSARKESIWIGRAERLPWCLLNASLWVQASAMLRVISTSLNHSYYSSHGYF